MAFDCIENDGPDWPAGSLADHEGLPGATTLGAYYGTVEQLDGGVTSGAQGWQMSFQASGCDAAILSVTATQTGIADGDIASCESGPGGSGGFDATELTSDPPAGNAGAVHAIVLHLKKGTTLDPTASNAPPATGPEQNPVSVVRFLVTCNNPAVDGDTCDLTLAFVDGLAGSGQPIDNKVTQDGQSVVPAFANETITKTAREPVIPCNEQSDQYGLAFSDAVIDSADYYDAGLLGAIGSGGTHAVLTPEGDVPATTLYLNLTVGPDVPLAQQPQGWQLSIGLTGAADLTEVSLGGAALYALNDGPNAQSGFDATEIIDPANNAGKEGFVSGVVLQLQKGSTLADLTQSVPGTASAVRIEVSGEGAQAAGTAVATLAHDNGLIGGGQPIDNKLTVEGDSLVPCNIIPPATADVNIEFQAGAVDPEFIRADANDDGRNNLADAVWILNGAFRNPPHVAAACEKASDANDDGVVDPIVDSAYIIAYQFSAGMAPPPPFGTGSTCGIDPTADALNCLPGSMTQCP